MKKMMKKSPFLLLLLILSCSDQHKQNIVNGSGSVQIPKPDLTSLIGKDFLIDDQHSYIGFRIKYFGNSTIRGRFDKFKGTAFYDTLTKFISTTIVIDVASINTGDKRRDDDLKQGAWFETSRFPSATFTSSATVRSTNGLELKGVFKIKNISKEITFRLNKPSQMTKDWAGNDQVDFSGEYTLSRKEFGVSGEGFWNEVMENGITQLSDEVLLEIEIHARRADYSMRKTKPDLMDSIATILLKEVELGGFEKVASSALNMDSQKNNKMDRATLYDFGNVLISEGKYKEALQVFSLLSHLYPEKVGDLNLVGICNLQSGNAQQAKVIFNQVISIDSLNTRAIEYLRNLK